MTSTEKHLFAGRQTLILTMAEVKQLLSVAQGIELQRIAFEDHATGQAFNAPSTWLRVNKHGGWMKLLAGFVDRTDAMAMKVLARYPNNPPGQNLGSLLILFDAENGFPLAIFDSVYITGVRTGAGGGLATKYCARPESRTVGVLGSGVQARFTLLAICELMPDLDQALVYSRNPQRRSDFCAHMEGATGMKFAPVESPEQAVSDADIIVTATNSPQPVLRKEWIKPGTHINAMGIKTEIFADVFPGALIYGDSVEVAVDDGKFSTAIKAGTVTSADLAGEIGEVLLGSKSGRTNKEQITIFDSAGLAVQDIVCAQHVYRQAIESQIGTWVDFGLAEAP